MKKKVIKCYKKTPDGRIDSNSPIYMDFDIKDKIKYYTQRCNDMSISKSQRYYAEIKVKMLTSGKGIIHIMKDDNFKGGKDKNRRVMQVGYNPNNDSYAISRITSSDGNGKNIKLIRRNVSILQKDSYLEPKLYIKIKKGGNIKRNDFKETSSTIHPFDYSNVFKTIFKNKDNVRLGKEYKK